MNYVANLLAIYIWVYRVAILFICHSGSGNRPPWFVANLLAILGWWTELPSFFSFQGQKKIASNSTICTVIKDLANFAALVCDWLCCYKALCDEKFSQIEGVGGKFSRIELNSVASSSTPWQTVGAGWPSYSYCQSWVQEATIKND